MEILKNSYFNIQIQFAYTDESTTVSNISSNIYSVLEDDNKPVIMLNELVENLNINKPSLELENKALSYYDEDLKYFVK